LGKSGPKPKPTSLRLLHGDRPSRINDREPVPATREVQPPESLSAAARDVWEQLAPDLEAKGCLTHWDVFFLEVFCDAVVQYRQASKLVTQAGVLIRGRKDALVKNPAMQLARDSARTMVLTGARFGLSPSDRAQIVLGRPPVDDREALLS
jgi:P27 family predicted phage terminase small subunit